MKIKLSKTIAVVLALCLIFTGFSAFAAGISMVTSYELGIEGTTEDVQVITTVTGAAEGDEVTYYVSKGDDILYINQLTADENGEVIFYAGENEKGEKTGFFVPWSKLVGATVVVGTDGSWTGNSAAPMSIVAGGNYMTAGSPLNVVSTTVPEPVENNDANTWLFDKEDAEGDIAYIFSGNVAGTYEEYGVTVTFLNKAGEEITVDFPAYGCNEDGSYFVAIKGAGDFDGDTVQRVKGYIK